MLELLENEKLDTRNREFEIREEFKIAHPDIAEKLESNEYSFLYENERLGDNIALLTLGGSYAYGLNTPSSDLDIRGVALNSKSDLLGLSNFEQFLNRETDTTIYGMNKFVNLMAQNNPNIVEILYCRPQDYAYISPIGQMLLDNRDIFLSQKAGASFSGYALAQIKRIENATARDRLPESKKQEHIATGSQSAVDNLSIQHDLDKYGEMYFKVDPETNQLLMDCRYQDLPVGEWIDLMNTTKGVLANYDKTAGNRNHKKDDAHLNKHMSHIIRLLDMGCTILEHGKVETYREKDKDFLLDIKNGKYMNEDGLFSQELWDYVYKLDEKLKHLKETTTLPKNCDYKKVEELLININEKTINNESNR